MSDPWKADEPIREENIINESERDSATPANDEYKLVKLEDDGRLAPVFLTNWELIDSWTHTTNVTEVVFNNIVDAQRLLVVMNAVPHSASGSSASRHFQVSEDNGASFLSTNKYMTNASFNLNHVVWNNLNDSSAVSGFVMIDLVNTDGPKPITANTGPYMVDSDSPINAVRIFITNHSFSGGSINLYRA